MTFDPQVHQDRITLIHAATVRRRLKGLPEEKNITILYNEICSILELPLIEITSKDANHFPAPAKMKTDTGQFVLPRKDCSQCGKKESMMLVALCQSCEDAEGGKYKTMWLCGEKDLNGNFISGSGCGMKDKSDKFFTQWMTELGIEIPTGPKKDFGIQTITDKGVE